MYSSKIDLRLNEPFFLRSSDPRVVFDPTIITGFFIHFIFLRVQLPSGFGRRHVFRNRYDYYYYYLSCL